MNKNKRTDILISGLKSLLISLIPIFSGPILFQIGYSKTKTIINFKSLLGILLCITAIIMIFYSLKKLGNYIFFKE